MDDALYKVSKDGHLLSKLAGLKHDELVSSRWTYWPYMTVISASYELFMDV